MYFFQLNVIATDGPGKTATGTVTIRVRRNLYDPQWVPQNGQLSLSINIDETKPLLETVATIRATDSDTQVILPLSEVLIKSLQQSRQDENCGMYKIGNVQ